MSSNGATSGLASDNVGTEIKNDISSLRVSLVAAVNKGTPAVEEAESILLELRKLPKVRWIVCVALQQAFVRAIENKCP